MISKLIPTTNFERLVLLMIYASPSNSSMLFHVYKNLNVILPLFASFYLFDEIIDNAFITYLHPYNFPREVVTNLVVLLLINIWSRFRIKL